VPDADAAARARPLLFAPHRTKIGIPLRQASQFGQNPKSKRFQPVSMILSTGCPPPAGIFGGLGYQEKN
jgi:hypothetical protein